MAFLATAAVVLALQTSAPPVKASIEGVVVRAGTSEVIPRVRITIFRSDQPSGPIPDVVSDDQGRFIIKGLDAGSYSLQAERNGFGRQPCLDPRVEKIAPTPARHLRRPWSK